MRCGASFGALSMRSLRASALGREIAGDTLLATKLLAGLTLLVFAAQVRADMARGLGFPFLNSNTIEAIHFGALLTIGEVVRAEPYRLLSAVFVHAGALHLGMNMLALANLSRVVEPAVGSARYAIAFVASGIVGFATTAAYTAINGEVIPTLGASGAIFGLMGLILGVLWRRRDPRWKSFAIQAVLFSVLLGFGINASKMGILVNNSAHLGGLGCGVAIGWVHASQRPRVSEAVVNVVALFAMAACVASLLLAHASPLWREVEQALSGG
jgi:membrane associated rhomboid family serine protease